MKEWEWHSARPVVIPLSRLFFRRTMIAALVGFAGAVPLLPTNAMKVTGTVAAGCVLAVGALGSRRSNDAPRWTALDVPVVAFFGIAVLSTALGVDPRASVGPSPLRGEGLLDYIVFLPMALAAARLTRSEAANILAVLVGAGGVVGAIAVGQYYGVDVTPWLGSRGFYYGLRSWGTLSNPDFLGGYATLVLPIGIALAATAPKGGTRLGCAAGATLLYGALVASESRSAWAAAALAAAMLLVLLPRSIAVYRRLALLGMMFAAATVLMMMTQPGVSLNGRAASAFYPADHSMQGRVWIWKHMVPMILERPVIGWGFSSVQGHLPGIGTPEYVRIFGRDRVIIDVAHNDLLQVAVNMGLVGLAAYVWIWATTLKAIHHAATGPAPAMRSDAAGILAGLVAYFVWLQFFWSHIGDANVFWVLAGIAVSLCGAASYDGVRGAGLHEIEAGRYS